ncbi:MAG TPA: helicase-related protein, partial [Planctomycetota bacterium]|nr:helicase-related protein [Planctomycetota bacterium]
MRRELERDTGDDRETQSREATAAGVVGAWLKGIAGEVEPEIEAIDRAVAALGLTGGDDDLTERTPASDARFDALIRLIEERLRNGGSWRDDERLVVFTEYKTTLDYLHHRLWERYDDDRILSLFGGMDDAERDGIKQAFNDPGDAVRVLLATDAAAEGLNLQRTARYLLHFDIPWNPSRLEQRNGRLDRHGQARDVTVFYFVSDRDQDVRFLAHVLRKANDIREDLGSANELFDEAAHRRLVEGEDERRVAGDLDLRIEKTRGRARVDADEAVETTEYGQAASEQLDALSEELDLAPSSLRDTLEGAMAIHAGRPQIDCAEDATCRLLNPGLPGWSEIVDESLRRRTRSGALGAVARLAFEPTPFLEKVGPRLVFQSRPDVALMHLSHPMIERTMAMLTRRRFPGTSDQVSRWSVRTGGVPEGADALILLTLEELAVNELRETFHHWIRTVALPVRSEALGDPLNHLPASRWNGRTNGVDDAARHHAKAIFFEVEPELRTFVASHTEALTTRLRDALVTAGEAARRDEEQRYRSRTGEVSALIESSTLQKLEREIERMRAARDQGLLFDQENRLAQLERSIEEKEREIERRRAHYNEVREQLERERER